MKQYVFLKYCIIFTILCPIRVYPANNDAENAELYQIETCLLEKNNSLLRSECIGLISKACLAERTPSSEIYSRDCYSKEWQIWDNILNKSYRMANNILSDSNNNYLKEAQIKWIDLRKIICSWPYEVYPNGSLQAPLSSQCFMIQTAFRAIDLLEIKERLIER